VKHDGGIGGAEREPDDSISVTTPRGLEARDRRASQDVDSSDEDGGQPVVEHWMGAERDSRHTDEAREGAKESVDDERARLMAELAKIDADIAAMVSGPARGPARGS
jgi:hypothetical protein